MPNFRHRSLANFDTQQIELDEVGWIDASCWISICIAVNYSHPASKCKGRFMAFFFFFCLISKRGQAQFKELGAIKKWTHYLLLGCLVKGYFRIGINS